MKWFLSLNLIQYYKNLWIYDTVLGGDIMKYKAVGLAILAAVLYGISAPISKVLLNELSPTFMAALLYLGAGMGMVGVNFYRKRKGINPSEAKISQMELPYVVGMIILDIAAPIFLMIGLSMTTSSDASLLNNFEIVATSLIALIIFKETIGKRLWIAIILITLSSMLLSITDISSFHFSLGSIFVLMACISWGFENNCTRMLSLKDPLQIVTIKGVGSGTGALLITIFLKAFTFNLVYILIAAVLGFFAYGMSIYFYIMAQRELGAARTSTYYAAAPFIGVMISWIMLHEKITEHFLIALFLMVLGAYFAVTEVHKHSHEHQEMMHDHKHSHSDGHHNHEHTVDVKGEHSHIHTHEVMTHRHAHLPDLHHRHSH